MARAPAPKRASSSVRPGSSGILGKSAEALALISMTFWAGGLWAVGYLAAPSLFAALPDKMMAGMLAGRMFTLISFVGMACGSYLLIHRLTTCGTGALKQAFFWVALLMLLLALGMHFGIQPVLASLKVQALPAEVMHSAFRDRFATWHGISSAVYLLQSLLAVVLVLKR